MTGIDFNRGTTNLMKVNFAFQDPQNVSVLRQLMAVDGPIKMVCKHNNLYSRCNEKTQKYILYSRLLFHVYSSQ